MTSVRDGRDARWEAHRQERRDAVLATAVRLIDTTGSAEASALSAATPIPRSTLYKLFDDLTDLDEQIRRAIIDLLVASVSVEMLPDDTVRTFARRTTEQYVAWVGAHPHLQRFLTGRTEAGAPSSAAVASGRRAFIDLIQAAAAVLFDVDPEEHADMLGRAAYGISGLFERIVVDHELANRDTIAQPADLAAYLTDAVCSLTVMTARSMGRELDPDLPLGATLPVG